MISRTPLRTICDAQRCSIMERFDELGGTLNGARAVIAGRLLDFPFVAALDGSAMKAEFSWQALSRAVRTGRVNLRSDIASNYPQVQRPGAEES